MGKQSSVSENQIQNTSVYMVRLTNQFYNLQKISSRKSIKISTVKKAITEIYCQINASIQTLNAERDFGFSGNSPIN